MRPTLKKLMFLMPVALLMTACATTNPHPPVAPTPIATPMPYPIHRPAPIHRPWPIHHPGPVYTHPVEHPWYDDSYYPR